MTGLHTDKPNIGGKYRKLKMNLLLHCRESRAYPHDHMAGCDLQLTVPDHQHKGV